jgi:hypothetical protein
MKKNILGLSLILLASLTHAQNGLDSVIVERFYVSDANDSAGSTTAAAGTLPAGSVTYRIYADMLPGYKFQALFGVPTHELKLSTTTTFFNNEDRGATTPNGITVTNTKKNSVMLDSWFSVGAAATGEIGVLKTEDTDGSIGNSTVPVILQNTDVLAGIPIKTQDGEIPGTAEAVTFVGLTTELNVFDATSQVGNLFSTLNGSIASLNGSVGPTAANRVLVGQFTTDGQFCYELNIQIGTPTGGVQQYVAKNPTGAEIQIPSLMGCKSGTSVGIKENNFASLSYKMSPNPAKDMVTLDFTSASVQGNNNSYTIYGVQGNEILHKELGLVNANSSESIDISSLSTGFYFIKVSVDGVVSTKKLIKN